MIARLLYVETKKSNRSVTFAAESQQQKKITVTGNVKDATGEPLIGVNVLVERYNHWGDHGYRW